MKNATTTTESPMFVKVMNKIDDKASRVSTTSTYGMGYLYGKISHIKPVAFVETKVVAMGEAFGAGNAKSSVVAREKAEAKAAAKSVDTDKSPVNAKPCNA